MPDLKADPETTWMRVKWLAPVVVVTVSATVIYMQIDYALRDIRTTMSKDSESRAQERESLVQSVNGVRDELRKVFVDSVATRQAQSWIELARALNKEKNGTIIWPDLPR